MKKLLSAIALSVLSLNASAWVSSTANTDKELRFPPNFTFAIKGQHSYAIGNDSGAVQDVTVCYTVSVCANAPNPAYHHTSQTCDKFKMNPGEATSGNKISSVDVNYPFLGWCNVDVSTEVIGWQHNVSTGAGKVKIWNS